MGYIPQNAQLTPRPETMPSQDSVPESERPFPGRLMEVFAGFTEHADVQVGRIVDEVDRLGYGNNPISFSCSRFALSQGATQMLKIAILDAARRMNPFENRFRRPGAGLAPLSTPGDTLVIYSAVAATPGGLLPLGGEGLFVSELVKEIRTPGTTAEETFKNTRVGVSQASSKEQNPMVSSSLTRDFSFADCRGTDPDLAPARRCPRRRQ